MRGLMPVAMALCLLAESGCKSRRRQRVEVVVEEEAGLSSKISMSSPHAGVQLIKGFHDPEGIWRWTQGKFVFTLKVPPGATRKGGTLTLQVTVPEVLMKLVPATTLSCAVAGQNLEPETFSKVGEYFVKRDVPASALSTEAATFDCALSKFIASGVLEERELGVIATSANLESK
jgi:hypothetical protein